MNIMCERLLLSACLLSLFGCSIPGWKQEYQESKGTFGSGQTEWYAVQSEESVVVEAEYAADLVQQITPPLIRKMHGQSWTDGVGVQNLPPDYFQVYTVGPGDVLSVKVFGDTDLSLPSGLSTTGDGFQPSAVGQLVGPDGTMFYPYVGRFRAEGMTLEQVSEKINRGLSQIIRRPQVDVSVLAYNSKKAFVVGTDGKPCAVPLNEFGVTLLEGLVLCESEGENAAQQQGGGASQVVRLVRDGKIYAVDLSDLYRTNNRKVYLQDNDRVVIDRNFNRVFIVGEFGSQKVKPIPTTGLTLAEAITSDGGLNVETADYGAIFVIRGLAQGKLGKENPVATGAQPEVFHLNAKSADALVLADQFQLRPRDIVYAAAADTVNFSRAVQQVLPVINSLFQTVFILDRAGDL